jgi:hypothetical protein
LPLGPRFLARVQSKGTVGNKQILSMMDFRNNSIGSAMTEAVLLDYFKVCQHFTLDGYNVNTGFFKMRPIIKAGFDSPHGEFDRNLHDITAAMNPGIWWAPGWGQAEVSKVIPNANTPLLITLFDAISEQSDSVITPGGMVQVQGDRLKFDKSDPAQGIFIVNGSLTEKAGVVGKNSSGELFFTATPLQDIDECTIEVRTRSTPNGELRIGRLPVQLTVQRGA